MCLQHIVSNKIFGAYPFATKTSNISTKITTDYNIKNHVFQYLKEIKKSTQTCSKRPETLQSWHAISQQKAYEFVTNHICNIEILIRNTFVANTRKFYNISHVFSQQILLRFHYNYYF